MTGGLAAGAALVIMASGLSLNGMQLLLMVALPALGWLAVALAVTSLPPTLLLGLAAGAVLAFVDVSPLAVEAADPALGWAWQAAMISVVLGWILALAAWLAAGTGRCASTDWRGVGGGCRGVGGGGDAFFTGGRTGFYGDRIFVVMESQADVSAAARWPIMTPAASMCTTRWLPAPMRARLICAACWTVSIFATPLITWSTP